MIQSIKSITVLCLLACTFSLVAQKNDFGKWSFSAGIGVVPTFLADGASVNTLPLSARLNYQINPAFSLAGYYGYTSYTSTKPVLVSDGQQSLMTNQISVYGLRGELKRSISRRFDLSGGMLVGYKHSDRREFDPVTGATIQRPVGSASPYRPGASKGGVIYSGFVGATYFPHRNIGIFAEAGFGISLLNTGVTVRI